jgi:hypothetical protein
VEVLVKPMSSEKHHILPVWFFAGVLLLIYGCLILASGLAEWSSLPDTALAELHAPVWWGGLMTAIGLFYTVAFRPGKSRGR